MAPHENEQTLYEHMLRLRNIVHLDRYRKRPVERDKDGFRKRHPKLLVAVILGVGALLTGALGAIVKRRGR